MSLCNQTVLLLDIQATAAASAGGLLLEVGWWRHPPGGLKGGIHSRLVKHPSIDISPRLTRLTGLSSDEMLTGCPPAEIWRQFQQTAGQVAATRADSVPVCPVVVHYARFEAPYIGQLQALAAAAGEVDLDLICTHEIARRLLPGLPRKGLRAVAGYFGHDTPSQRRCSHHLRATAAIWTGLIAKLRERHRIATLEELKAWLEKTPIPTKVKRSFQVPGGLLARLPHRPGVYRLLSHSGKCLYVGKAKDLNRRVRTYFQPRRRHAEHILEMLSRAANLKISPTRTALEAALLEHDLIKRLAPPYNIALGPDAAELQFWSREFQYRSSRRDRRHPWGPLPGGEVTAITNQLAQVLRKDEDLDAALLADLQRTLANTSWETPTRADLETGLQLFRKAHRTHIKRLSPGHALQAIGRRLWFDQHLAATADTLGVEDPPTSTVPQADDDASAPFWHPERVCRHLEHAVCHTAALVRRSRWLALLGNATLTWASPHNGTQCRRRLVFRRGVVVARGGPGPLTAAAPGLPASYWSPGDRITYDRLRVATTELRRLAQEKRPLTICLGHTKNKLHSEQVVRLLGWI